MQQFINKKIELILTIGFVFYDATFTFWFGKSHTPTSACVNTTVFADSDTKARFSADSYGDEVHQFQW